MLESLLRENPLLFLDSMIFIYHFEYHEKFITLTNTLFQNIQSGVNQGLTSVISIGELLVKPYEEKSYKAIDDYHALLKEFPNLKILDIDYKTANLAASVSAKYHLDLPDALQIASALENNASLFLTNDLKLKKVEEIKVIALNDF